ncbi:GIY-YIG nuclease family protein [Gracilibacillus marinus]|jgi:putative endonuclease|uniref:GIY-YIG nuclease family protein n=1 Tax=Gracilibacillus marinus TaxID=630535 RepID=A0ABV8VXP5_9BACI
MAESKHYVYILRCKDATLYTGYTTNVERRVKMHQNGNGAKYTRGRGPFTVVFQKECESKSEALQLEARIKKLTRYHKMKLILENEKERFVMNENSKELSEG